METKPMETETMETKPMENKTMDEQAAPGGAANAALNPRYYRDGAPMRRLECIDVARLLPFDLGCAVKYLWRAGRKSGENWRVELGKARWYLRDWVESWRTRPPMDVQDRSGFATVRALLAMAEPEKGDGLWAERLEAMLEAIENPLDAFSSLGLGEDIEDGDGDAPRRRSAIDRLAAGLLAEEEREAAEEAAHHGEGGEV